MAGISSAFMVNGKILTRANPRVQIPPLKTLTLKSRPLTTHAITFSCDAELAVAADDSVHVFLPEFPSEEPPAPANAENIASAATALTSSLTKGQDSDNASRQQYYTYINRIPTSRKPDPRMNAALFAAQGLEVPEYYGDMAGDDPGAWDGVGSGVVTGFGASLNQVVAIGWSPGGLGRNLRAVLAVMLTSGALVIIGEGSGGGVDRIDFGARMRSFRDWRILWGVGANLPLPDAGSENGAYLPSDKVRSFAWAKKIEPGRALLSYATDQEEIVVLSVQYYLPNEKDDSSDAGSYIWEVEEVARFAGRGPHPPQTVRDPDYVPYASAFSLKWSPWLLADGTRTAVLSYCAKSYVGFRRVTIPRDWKRGAGIEIGFEDADVSGICVNLLTGSFVEWEDVIWDREGAKVCRGVIATPFKARAFEVALNGPGNAEMESHPMSVCNTTYPEDSTSLDATNPITSLIIHTPDMTRRSTLPSYSIVRLSATGSNDNWFQQNTANVSNTSGQFLPKWAETISSIVKLSVPVSMLGRGGAGGVGVVAGGDAESVASADSSDSDDDDFDLPEDAGEQIHPYRVRIWGLTTSPAGGVSAALVSQHSKQRPEKSTKTKVLFGGRSAGLVSVAHATAARETGRTGIEAAEVRKQKASPFWDGLSTEAKLWEWMYGAGPPVPGTFAAEGEAAPGDVSLKERFLEVKKKQVCVFCKTPLKEQGKQFVCDRGHIFANCASTGLAILAPGISRACAVCGLRCLVGKEVLKIAQEHLGSEARVETSEDTCGGCGGKFVA